MLNTSKIFLGPRQTGGPSISRQNHSEYLAIHCGRMQVFHIAHLATALNAQRQAGEMAQEHASLIKLACMDGRLFELVGYGRYGTMTRTSLSPLLLLFGMALLAGLGALVLLGSAQVTTAPVVHQASAVTIDWLQPDQVMVPQGLTTISTHAAKHHGDTEKIYQMLLQGQCTEVAKFCGGSESEFAYFCVDPVTGVVGAILQIGDEITTG